MTECVECELTYDDLLEVHALLGDVVLASQELQHRYGNSGRPYLAFRARELQHECFALLDVIEMRMSGWAPIQTRAMKESRHDVR